MKNSLQEPTLWKKKQILPTQTCPLQDIQSRASVLLRLFDEDVSSSTSSLLSSIVLQKVLSFYISFRCDSLSIVCLSLWFCCREETETCICSKSVHVSLSRLTKPVFFAREKRSPSQQELGMSKAGFVEQLLSWLCRQVLFRDVPEVFVSLLYSSFEAALSILLDDFHDDWSLRRFSLIRRNHPRSHFILPTIVTPPSRLLSCKYYHVHEQTRQQDYDEDNSRRVFSSSLCDPRVTLLEPRSCLVLSPLRLMRRIFAVESSTPVLPRKSSYHHLWR